MISRLLPILAVLIAIGVYFGYVGPTYSNQIVPAQQQITSYDSALAAATAFNQKENQLIAARNAIPAASIDRLQSFLPDGVDNIQLILDLNALAARSGLSLSDFQVQNNATTPNAATDPADTTNVPLQSASPTSSLDLTVSATGTYSAFKTFLTGIEQSLRPMDLTSLTIQDSATGVYTYNLTLHIYWLR